MIEVLHWTPHARDELAASTCNPDLPPLELARQTIVRLECGLNHTTHPKTRYASRLSHDAPFSHVHPIAMAKAKIHGLTARLQTANIENQPAFQLLHRANRQPVSHDILIYADPPYRHETRVASNQYNHEMNMAEHRDFLIECAASPHRIRLSGDPNPLYDEFLPAPQWCRIEYGVGVHHTNKASRASNRRVECLRLNYPPPQNSLDLG